jgi:hypothetical protein
MFCTKLGQANFRQAVIASLHGERRRPDIMVEFASTEYRRLSHAFAPWRF